MFYPLCVLALDQTLPFEPARGQEFLAAVPARPAVFCIEMHDANATPFLSRTADLRRRLERLLAVPAAPTKRLNLREVAARVRYRVTGSAFEQALVLYQQARELYPRRYRDFLRMRPPALLKLTLRNEYPRCYVTRRILVDDALYIGPFARRKYADAFAQEFLNLFKLRRCQIKIRRDPSFPGCIYSEMKMCLAPCFAGCSKEEYDVEVGRVRNFLASRGGALESELEGERAAASDALDFERAAAVHRRIEKVQDVLRKLPDLPRRVQELDAVIVQRAAEKNAAAIFVIKSAHIADPFVLQFGKEAAAEGEQASFAPRLAEEELREKLSATESDSDRNATEAGAQSVQELSDHLSLLARWHYGKPRHGEVFFPQPGRAGTASAAQQEWPLRRIIRACSRVLAARPEASATGAASPDTAAPST